MTGTYEFLPIERVRFGPGSVREIADDLDDLGARRVLVVASQTLAETSQQLDGLAALVGDRLAGTVATHAQHVPVEVVLGTAAEAGRIDADAIVTLGGSSVHDLGKAVAMCRAEDIEDADALRAMRVEYAYPDIVRAPTMTGAAPPVLAVSTTLSAGEFTHGFGVTDPVRGAKDIFLQRGVTPRVVVLDAEVARDTPDWLWCATGVRAVDHAVESLYSTAAQPVTDTLCQEALRGLASALPAAHRDPEDMEARTQGQVAAWMSFFGVVNVMHGLSHALGHQLGARHGVAHGHTSCVLLPEVMAFNLPVTTGPQARVARALGVARSEESDESAAQRAAEGVRQLVRALDQPTRLRDLGLGREHLADIARDAVGDTTMRSNPRPVENVGQVEAILERAW